MQPPTPVLAIEADRGPRMTKLPTWSSSAAIENDDHVVGGSLGGGFSIDRYELPFTANLANIAGYELSSVATPPPSSAGNDAWIMGSISGLHACAREGGARLARRASVSLQLV